jgi:hypothetical protein
MMPAGGPGGFEQAYNAQTSVEIHSRLIVGQPVTQAANDKKQLVPTGQAIEPAAGPVKEILIDSSFVSEAAIRQIEPGTNGQERHRRGSQASANPFHQSDECLGRR